MRSALIRELPGVGDFDAIVVDFDHGTNTGRHEILLDECVRDNFANCGLRKVRHHPPNAIDVSFFFGKAFHQEPHHCGKADSVSFLAEHVST